MWGFRKIQVAPYQRGLKFVDEQLVELLGSGEHRWFDASGRRVRVELVDLCQPEVKFARADAWLRSAPAILEPAIEVIDLAADELGLLYLQGKFSALLQPGSRSLFWRGLVEVRVDRISVGTTLEIAPELLRQMLQPAASSELGRQIVASTLIREVPQHSIGLLLVDGRLQGTIGPGLHGWWKVQRSVQLDLIDLRQTAVEVNGQEILTRDKLSLRANLAALYKVVDPVLARTAVKDYGEALYRELQFGLRQAIGTRTLDSLLANKSELDEVVLAYAAPKLSGFGIELVSVGVKDLILPGEIKDILNQVVQAEKTALANVIRRREETAATRSLLNTAKLIDESPALMRLKELEALEKITEKINQLTVFGGLDGVLKQLVQIKS